MIASQRGFALLTVLVILSAVSLLGMLALERGAIATTFGKTAHSYHQREGVVRNAILTVVANGLSVGVTDLCINGVCGRTTSGVPRAWTPQSVVALGVDAQSGVECQTRVVSEYLGSADDTGYWRVAAACTDTVSVADIAIGASGEVSAEWASHEN